jgi:hypothetical protein
MIKNDKRASPIKRLIADIDEDLHCKIKANAAFKNITLRKYLMQIIYEGVMRDAQYINQ